MRRDGGKHRIERRVWSEHADSTVLGEEGAKDLEKAWMSSDLPCVESSAASEQTEGLLVRHPWPALLWFINSPFPSLGKDDISPPC